ncbi:MAG: helix-turn-helix domain-containing protein [Clostridia bacterium]|nr:helix-turn-helix domain-containing protein [Clostridia bacterium]
MPKGERKEYRAEYKHAAVMMMKSGVIAPKEVFRILGGIDRQTVYRWVHEYEQQGEGAFRSEKAVLPGSKLKALQRENKALREENEILKKAAAYFAEMKKKD